MKNGLAGGPSREHGPHILLTGATGFLGRFLLRDLLLAGHRVAVLARPKGPVSARKRIRRLIEDWRALGYDLPTPRVIEGRLDRENLGWTESATSGWPEIDKVLHNAGSVLFASDSASGEPFRTNVTGTEHLLEWARKQGVVAFHHVSSAYVSGNRKGVILESDLDRGQAFKNPYERSKFEAEQRVRRATGFDTTIYRPSIIVGDQASGAAPGVRGFGLAVRAIESARRGNPGMDVRGVLRTLGASDDAGKNLVPVDWVSAVIVERVGAADAGGKTYHLTSPVPTSLRTLLSAIDDATGRDAPEEKGPGSADPRAPAAFLAEYGDYLSDDPAFDQTNLERDVPQLPCPPLDPALLVRQMGPGIRRGSESIPLSSGSVVRRPLAIVGMACRLPGACNLDEYWSLISEGRHAIVPLPESRLDRARYFEKGKGRIGKTYSDLGGLVDEQPPSAELIRLLGDRLGRTDACHRILADVALEACRNAGFDGASFPDPRAGVYVGHAGGSPRGGDAAVAAFAESTAALLRELPEVRIMGAATREASVLAFADALRHFPGALDESGEPRLEAREAARLVADTLRTTGPALVVDAACASSLTALGLAALALEAGEIETAVVAGASMASAQSLVLFSRAQSCSATGSRPFDDEADGLVASEGYVVLIIKTLDRALREGDDIKAVIRGLGMSSDGRALSLWAPRKEGQIAALERAYCELDPGHVDYVEAHATSTQVGDATEIEALAEFFGPRLNGRRVPIGSVKSNLGHTLETAGLASLVKVVLALRHGVAPPTANLETLNRKVSWDASPFEVLRKAAALPPSASRARCAGVSAFGIGGLNVHVVVEEFHSKAAAATAARVSPPPRSEIAIVGRGLVTAGGPSLRKFAEFIGRGQSAIDAPPRERNGGRTLAPAENLGGYIRDYRFDWRRLMLPPRQIERANPLRFLLLDSVEQALREARSLKSGRGRARSAVVVGLDFSSDFGNALQLGLRLPEITFELEKAFAAQGLAASETQKIVRAFEAGFLRSKPALLDETGGFTSSSLASGIAKVFDLMGGALAIDAGRRSGTAALNAAAALLRSGAVDSVVCAAGQRSMDSWRYDLSRRRREIPPAPDASWPGEGAAALVLKRLDDARRDGDAVLGLLRDPDLADIDDLRGRIGDVGGALPLISLIRSSLTAGNRREERSGSVIRPTDSGPRVRVAFAFPGQGAHHPAMFELLLRDSAAAREIYRRANAAAAAMKLDSFEVLVTAESLDHDPVAAQLCVLVADVMADAALREMGVVPDCVFGHSFGELAALVAAQVWSLEQALRIGLIRARAIAAAPRGRLLALPLSEAETSVLLKQSGLPIFVTHINAPQQTVVGGDLDAMAELLPFLSSRGVQGIRLNVAGALHTPLMKEARAILGQALENEVLQPPTTLLLTSAANRYSSEPGEIRANLSAQLTEPVLYQRMVERLVRDGIGVVIEAGPRSVLTGLHRRILEGEACTLLSTAEFSKEFASPLSRVRDRMNALGLLASASLSPTIHGNTGSSSIVEFDATARRREKRSGTARRAATFENRSALVEAHERPSDLLRFLLDFVVEHTGYPEDVIDLDWDFEADLGIDSIKRAQLFGEVADLLRLTEETAQPLLKSRTLRAVLEATGRPRGQATTLPRKAPPAKTIPSQGPLDEPVTRRHRLALVDAPLRRSPHARPRLLGPSIILGSNPVSEALRTKIESLGHRATLLPTTADIPRLIADVEALAGSGPIPHLFVTTPRDAEAATTFDHDRWRARRIVGVEAPFELSRRWLSLLEASERLADATLVGVLSAGGSHGFAAPAISAESGAISGLFKAISIEQWVRGFRSTRMALIDSPSDEDPNDLAEAILSELAVPSYDSEVGWSRGRRQCVQAIEEENSFAGQEAPVRRGAVWVCTGGARGVTRFLAQELAARFGVRLHLVGASPAPALSEDVRERAANDVRDLRLDVMRLAREKGENPVEAWQAVEKALEIRSSLDEFERSGVHARYHSCDVGDRDALATTLERIHAEDGPIEGVLHGAGFSRDARIDHKRPEHVARCFRSKLDGAFHLMDLTRQDPIRHFVAMGSISGRFGANGQSDYSLANDMLAKLVSWYRGQRPDVAAVNFDWHAWDDFGMATRAETRLALESIGMRFMPAREGASHLLSELAAGARSTEVLITDDRYARMFGLGHLLARVSDANAPETGAPLFQEGRIDREGEEVRARVTFNPRTEPFLAEHRFDGTPLLPFALSLELLCEAGGAAFAGRRPAALRGVRAARALWFAGGRPRTLEVETRRVGPHVMHGIISAELVGPDGRVLDERRPYFEGEIEWEATEPPATGTSPRPSPIETWPRVDYGSTVSAFELGPPFRALQRLAVFGSNAWAEIVAPEPTEIGGLNRARDFSLPCAVIDACFQAVARFAAAVVENTDSFPLALDLLTLGRLPDRGESCTVEARLLHRETTQASFDFRVTGADDDLLFEGRGYRVAWQSRNTRARSSA